MIDNWQVCRTAESHFGGIAGRHGKTTATHLIAQATLYVAGCH